jgi:hypothetical protein
MRKGRPSRVDGVHQRLVMHMIPAAPPSRFIAPPLLVAVASAPASVTQQKAPRRQGAVTAALNELTELQVLVLGPAG